MSASSLSLIFGLSLRYVLRDYPEWLVRSIRIWTQSTLLFSIAWALFGLRGTVQDLLSLVISNALLSLAFARQMEALQIFAGQRVDRAAIYSAVAAMTLLMILFVHVVPDTRSQIVGASAVICLQLLAALRTLAGTARHGRRSKMLVAAAYALVCAVLATRMAYEGLRPGELPYEYASTPMQVIVFMSAAFSPLVASVGFILMCSDRLNQELGGANAILVAITEGTTDAVFVKDLESRHVMINGAGARFLDHAPMDVIGKTDFELLARPIAQWTREADLRVMNSGVTETAEIAVTTLAGKEGIFSTVRAPWREASGRIVGVIGVARDITAQKQDEQTILRHAARMADMFEQSLGLLFTHDLEGILLSINPAAAKSLAYARKDLLGRNLLELVPENSRRAFADYLTRIASNEIDSGVLQVTTSEGQIRFWEYHNRVYRGSGSPPYVMGNAADVSERRALEQSLRELSVRDPLTGCYNRRYLEERCADVAPGHSWGCVMVDLDGFKSVNDTFGHQHGDDVLIAMGRFLDDRVRENDAVIRMGGDEFMLLLPDADESVVNAVAGRIRAAESSAPCAISIGHALREGAESLEKTIDRADKHLYRNRIAVRGGDGRVQPAPQE